MCINYENDEWECIEWEPSKEEIARLKRAEQDINMGLSYQMIFDGDCTIGEMKCNKCGRTGHMIDRPFPHRIDCPMRRDETREE